MEYYQPLSKPDHQISLDNSNINIIPNLKLELNILKLEKYSWEFEIKVAHICREMFYILVLAVMLMNNSCVVGEQQIMCACDLEGDNELNVNLFATTKYIYVFTWSKGIISLKLHKVMCFLPLIYIYNNSITLYYFYMSYVLYRKGHKKLKLWQRIQNSY